MVGYRSEETVNRKDLLRGSALPGGTKKKKLIEKWSFECILEVPKYDGQTSGGERKDWGEGRRWPVQSLQQASRQSHSSQLPSELSCPFVRHSSSAPDFTSSKFSVNICQGVPVSDLVRWNTQAPVAAAPVLGKRSALNRPSSIRAAGGSGGRGLPLAGGRRCGPPPAGGRSCGCHLCCCWRRKSWKRVAASRSLSSCHHSG